MERQPTELPDAPASGVPPATAARDDARCVPSPSHPADRDLTPFFHLALDLFCLAGFDGYLKHLNAAWTTCLGWTLEELKSRPFVDRVHPDDRVLTGVEMKKLATGAATSLFVNRCRHRDGSYRWLQWNAFPCPRNGFIYVTAHDITEHKLLEREIIQIADREKEHLGRELHDGICQTIVGIAALGTALSRRLKTSGDAESSDVAAEITCLLQKALAEIRNLSHSLAPPVRSESDLCDSLETLALQCGDLFGVTCNVACAELPGSLSPEVKFHLLRIAQEALSNAVTHGHADRIDINLSRTDRRGMMVVLDNGSGIGASGKGYTEGIGLRSMAHRAGLIGGYLRVTRRRRQGTAVVCIFPPGADRAGPESPRDGSE
jgi:PAS domain S-box-containing protein